MTEVSSKVDLRRRSDISDPNGGARSLWRGIAVSSRVGSAQ